jgi:hypothetical protein
MLCWKSSRTLVLPIILGMALLESASAQSGVAPILLHPRLGSDALPVAIFQNIKVEDFRKLVIGAFEASRFSFTSMAKSNEGETQYKFSYPVAMGRDVRNVELVVRVDENPDKHKRCANCFLRMADLPDISALSKLPWMTQYEVSSQVFPAVDRAYARIRVDGQSSMDSTFKFDYRDRWRGERNLYQNSFVGIDLPDLKTAIVDAYRAAGFTFVGDAQKDSSSGRPELVFSYPVDPNQTAGVAYRIIFANQFNGLGNCYPCETMEAYDPYQQLPPAGLAGISDRLSLESRFVAARTLAFERMKVATERYLRPRSVFVVPPKPAPLGSPRPRPVPIPPT